MGVITVSEVAEVFSSSFESIDIRIAAARSADKWINVITSIFLSIESEDETKAKQQQLIEKLPENTDMFLIILDSRPFRKLPILFNQIKQGKITVYTSPVQFRETVTVQSREIDPSVLTLDLYHPRYLKEIKDWRLIGAEAKAQEAKRQDLWPIVDSQNGFARLRGFESIYKLIGETLGIKDFSRGIDTDLVIGIPIPARIASASLSDSSLEVKTKKVFRLSDLQLNLFVNRGTPTRAYPEVVWREQKLVKQCKKPKIRRFCYATNSTKLPDLMAYDSIEIELIHRKLPTLDIGKTSITVPLQNPVEPFSRTLSSFCSCDVFKERLLSPEKFKKSSMVFENAVAWLLSLAGFYVLPLGRDFEKLKIHETGYEVGSVDIVAYRENEYLLLIDCDTSVPDDKKIRSMITVKEHFKFIQDEHGRPRIVSVICSPKNCQRISVDRQAINIVDKYMLTQIFEEVMKGNQTQARFHLVY